MWPILDSYLTSCGQIPQQRYSSRTHKTVFRMHFNNKLLSSQAGLASEMNESQFVKFVMKGLTLLECAMRESEFFMRVEFAVSEDDLSANVVQFLKKGFLFAVREIRSAFEGRDFALNL